MGHKICTIVTVMTRNYCMRVLQVMSDRCAASGDSPVAYCNNGRAMTLRINQRSTNFFSKPRKIITLYNEDNS